MAFNVRVYGYRGTRDLRRILPQQFSSDSIQQLDQPYEFAEKIAVGAVAVSSAPNDNANVTILMVEVPDGQTVRYEINPPGRDVAAADVSPSLSGKNQFAFSPGWSISLIDAAGLP